MEVVKTDINLDELNFFLRKSPKYHKNWVEEYWKEYFFKEKKDALDNDRKKLYEEPNFSLKNNDINNAIIELIKNNDATREEIIELFLDKQENSHKYIKIYKIPENVEVLTIEKNLLELFGIDKFNKHELCKNINKIINQKLQLIYINKKNDNEFILVYNYLVKWKESSETDSMSLVEKTDVTPVVIKINTLSRFAELRITKLSKMKTIDDCYKELKSKLQNILKIEEDAEEKQLEEFVIESNVNKLFSNAKLIKYEGEHTSTDDGKVLTIKFSLHGGAATKVDYAKLKPYELLKDLINSNLVIRGSWNTDIEKDIFIPKTTRKIRFDVRNNEIISQSSFTEKELNYALSHITDYSE